MASGGEFCGNEVPSAEALGRFQELQSMFDTTYATEGALYVTPNKATQLGYVDDRLQEARLRAPLWTLDVDSQPRFHAVDAQILVGEGYPKVDAQNYAAVVEQAVQGVMSDPEQARDARKVWLISKLFKAAKSGELSGRNELLQRGQRANFSRKQIAVRGLNVWFENNSRVVGYRVADQDLDLAAQSGMPEFRLELFGTPENSRGTRTHFRYEQADGLTTRSLRRMAVIPLPDLRSPVAARFGPLCAPRVVAGNAPAVESTLLSPSPLTGRKLATFNDGLAAALESGALAERPPLSWRLHSLFLE